MAQPGIIAKYKIREGTDDRWPHADAKQGADKQIEG